MNKELQDLAWSILPKEFKEEVKRKFQLTDADCIAYEILIDLFGIHNLTSDAQGEEMLACDRDVVRMLYDGTDSVKVRQVLEGIFGSKCLPDELNEDNFAKSEPKPAEPKKKRHVSVKEACEILGVDESEATTLVKSKPIETCTDDCSSPDHFVVKDEMVDNIIKDGFKNHNRLNIAAMAMQGILSNIDLFKNVLETGMETLGGDGISFRAVAKSSFLFADALINEAEEGDSK